MSYYFCYVCDEPIDSLVDIENRHTDNATGEDVHAECCLDCKENHNESET